MSAGTVDDQRIVDELDRAWNEAYEKNNRSALASLLAEDFEAVLANGERLTKAQLMQPTPAPRSIAFSERSLRLLGATAIARGRLQLEHDGGRVDQRFMRVYAKRERWQAIEVQVFPVVE